MTTRIAFVNGKGGVGKTTCATLLAATLKDVGFSVSIEDRDPQGSATTAANVFGLLTGTEGQIIIVDTAPNIAAPETLDAIRSADLVILVTTPSPLDLATTAATARRIQDERRGETRVLFNLVQTTNRFFNEMAGIAQEYPFPTLKNFLTRRTSFQVAQIASLKGIPGPHKEEIIKVAIEIAKLLPR
jgi:chromosome partitioning protein